MQTAKSLTINDFLLVAAGGAVGAMARWALVEVTAGTDASLAGPVLLANLIGCAVLGVLLGSRTSHSANRLIGMGFCGGLTTFSTFSVEVARALRDGNPSGGIVYAVLSVTGGLLIFSVGRKIGRATSRSGPC